MMSPAAAAQPEAHALDAHSTMTNEELMVEPSLALRAARGEDVVVGAVAVQRACLAMVETKLCCQHGKAPPQERSGISDRGTSKSLKRPTPECAGAATCLV